MAAGPSGTTSPQLINDQWQVAVPVNPDQPFGIPDGRRSK